MNKEIFVHLRDLEENLKDWKSYLQATPLEKFLTERFNRHALLHAVTVALQAAIDIANHWVSEMTSERPETYKAIAELLAERKAIPLKLSLDLQSLFGLRNVLIHKYQDLDLKALYSELHRGIEPLSIFLNRAKNKFSYKK